MTTPKNISSWLQIQRSTDPDTGHYIDVPTGRYNLNQGQEAWTHLRRLNHESQNRTVVKTAAPEGTAINYKYETMPLYHYRLAHYTVNVLTEERDVTFTPINFDRWRAGEHSGSDLVTTVTTHGQKAAT